MFKRLEEIIRKLEGNVLAITIDSSLLEKLKSNNKINLYSIDSPKSKMCATKSKSKIKVTSKGKEISIKKLRKYINKKSAKYIILNMEEVFKYYKYIVRDTIYLGNTKIIIYASNSIDKEFIISRYKRYNTNIETTDYKNGYIVTVDCSNSKSSLLKDIRYMISDTLYNIAELIGNILVS